LKTVLLNAEKDLRILPLVLLPASWPYLSCTILGVDGSFVFLTQTGNYWYRWRVLTSDGLITLGHLRTLLQKQEYHYIGTNLLIQLVSLSS